MLSFSIRRLISAVLVLFSISVLVFLIFFATPGVDPAAQATNARTVVPTHYEGWSHFRTPRSEIDSTFRGGRQGRRAALSGGGAAARTRGLAGALGYSRGRRPRELVLVSFYVPWLFL